ncbi:MAG: type IV pilus biogenesis/stability protein PilW [Proteobacteria bacterium]|nr:type IV pilus biogenesis/stability protein PilW [Pseudomonadota bacterium]
MSALFKIAFLIGALWSVAACNRNQIIQVNNGASDLKNAPEESKQEQNEDAARIQTQLGSALMQQGSYKDAYDHLQKAIQFDRSYVPAHTVLAVLYEQTRQLQNAESEYRAAVSIDPKNGDNNNNLGYFLCRHGRGKEGMDYLQRALADPYYKTPAQADTNAGACLAGMGDRAGADTYLRKALEIDPLYSDALYQMAHLQYTNGDAFRARGFLQRFETQGRATPDSLLLGYDIETRLGNVQAAQDYANRLSAQFPESEQAQTIAGRSQ